MPVTSGAAFFMTLIPAAIFLTYNYIGGDGSSPGGLSLQTNKSSIITNGSSATSFSSFKSSDNIIEESASDIKTSSVFKKSVTAEQLGLQVLPTCCGIEIKKGEGGKDVLSYCDKDGMVWDSNVSNGQEDVVSAGVWDVPSKLVFRQKDSYQFRLENRRPTCSATSSGAKFIARLSLSSAQSSSKNPDQFLSNGFLKFQNEYYRPDQYCLNGFKDDHLEIQICKANCSDPKTPCVQKCCSFDEVYSLGMHGKSGGCQLLDSKKNQTLWSPVFYDDLNKKLSLEDSRKLRPHIIHKSPSSFKPDCLKTTTTVYPYGEDVASFLTRVLRRPLPHLQFQLRKDGWLIHPNSTATDIAVSKSSKTTRYCIDGVQNYGEDDHFSNLETQTVLFVCAVPEKEDTTTEKTSDVDPSYEKMVVSSSMSVTSSVSSVKPTVPTSSTTSTSTTTTQATTTTPRPVIVPTLPTCCHLDPVGAPGAKLNHYCTSSNNEPSGSVKKASEWMAAPKFMRTNRIQKFKLESQPLKCKDNWTKAFILNYDNLPGGGSPSLLPNGHLKFQHEFFRPGEYCVNGIFSSIVEVLMCKTNCSSPHTPCINKCCGPNEIYSLGAGGKRRGCIPLSQDDTPWNPHLYNDMSTPLSPKEMEGMQPHLVQKFPPKFQYNCFKNVTLVFPYMKEVVPLMSPLAKINLEFKLRKDGKVMYRHPLIKDSTGKLTESVFNNVEYCLDGIRNFGEPDPDGPYQSRDNQTVLFVCAMNPPS